MTPDYKITAEDKDVTDRIKGRLVSLSVSDNTGELADTLRIVLSNADGALILPEPGALLTLDLGYKHSGLRSMGTFTLDEIAESGPPDQVTLTAKAACFSAGSQVSGQVPLNSQKQRSWDAGITVAAMVETIAAEAGLSPTVTPTAAKIVLPHVDQNNESDMNMLTRLAAQYDFWVKPGWGRLLCVHRNDVTASLAEGGTVKDAVPIRKSDCTNWQFSRRQRPQVVAVIAIWRDFAAAQDVEERVGGDQEPVQRLKVIFPDAGSAREAANAHLRFLRRSGTTFTLQLPAPAAMNLHAEGSIRAEGFRPQIDGVWKIKSVDWNLSASGLGCSVKCETSVQG